MENKVEYIERGLLIKHFSDVSFALFRISQLPAADVAPVVRCKVCAFWAPDQSHLCCKHNTVTGGNDYCSCGVRSARIDKEADHA